MTVNKNFKVDKPSKLYWEHEQDDEDARLDYRSALGDEKRFKLSNNVNSRINKNN